MMADDLVHQLYLVGGVEDVFATGGREIGDEIPVDRFTYFRDGAVQISVIRGQPGDGLLHFGHRLFEQIYLYGRKFMTFWCCNFETLRDVDPGPADYRSTAPSSGSRCSRASPAAFGPNGP